MNNRSDILLSIIIPFKNRVSLIKRTLRSLSDLESPGESVNLIFVDNGSTDASVSAIKYWMGNECPAWIMPTLLSCEEPGAAAARNKGLESASTPWVMFFDSDDEMLPPHISNVLSAIRLNNEADIIYWDIIIENNGKESVKKPRQNSLTIDVVMHAVWATQRFAIKRFFLLQAGAWNRSLPAWTDWELSVRMLLLAPLAVHLTQSPTVIAHHNNDSITGKDFKSKQGVWEMAVNSALSAAKKHNHKEITNIIYLKEAVLAANYAREGANDVARDTLMKISSCSSLSTSIIKLVYLWQKYLGRGSAYLIGLLKKCGKLA